MNKTSTKSSYNELKDELDLVISKLQDEGIDIDEALELYQRGNRLIEELDARLARAKNSIKKISSQSTKKKTI